jgi:hypothetical protein
MATRKLKLPDGGTMDLPLPAGFGDSTDLAASTEAGRSTMYVVGAVTGAIAGFLIVLAASKIAEAIESK